MTQGLAVRGPGAGPIFNQIDLQGLLTEKTRSDRSIALLIQKYAERVGIDPETVGGIRCMPGS